MLYNNLLVQVVRLSDAKLVFETNIHCSDSVLKDKLKRATKVSDMKYIEVKGKNKTVMTLQGYVER